MKKEYLKPELIDLNETAGLGHTATCRNGSGAYDPCQVGTGASESCIMGPAVAHPL